MTGIYVLDEHHNIHPQPDLLKWGKWMETPGNRIVKQETLPDGVTVSTVFLGLDHRFGDDGPPVLFETMIFGGEHDNDAARCCTWDEALAQHERLKQRATGG